MYNIHKIHQHIHTLIERQQDLKNNPYETTLAPSFEYHKFMVLTYTIRHFVFAFASAFERNFCMKGQSIST